MAIVTAQAADEPLEASHSGRGGRGERHRARQDPIARLTPVRPPPAAPRFGALKRIVSAGSEFFEPITDSELAGRE